MNLALENDKFYIPKCSTNILKFHFSVFFLLYIYKWNLNKSFMLEQKEKIDQNFTVQTYEACKLTLWSLVESKDVYWTQQFPCVIAV